jgi:hypothetical protein
MKENFIKELSIYSQEQAIVFQQIASTIPDWLTVMDQGLNEISPLLEWNKCHI